jgi:hypothetical protein
MHVQFKQSVQRVCVVCSQAFHRRLQYDVILFRMRPSYRKKTKTRTKSILPFCSRCFCFFLFFFRCCFFHFVCFLFVFCFVMLLGRIRTSITSLQFFFIFVYFNVTRLSDLEKIFLYPISHGSVFPVKLVVSHVPLSVLIAYWLMIVSLFLLVFGKTNQRTKRVFAASPLRK